MSDVTRAMVIERYDDAIDDVAAYRRQERYAHAMSIGFTSFVDDTRHGIMSTYHMRVSVAFDDEFADASVVARPPRRCAAKNWRRELCRCC